MKKDEFFAGSEWEIDPESMTENEHVLISLYRTLDESGMQALMSVAMQAAASNKSTKRTSRR